MITKLCSISPGGRRAASPLVATAIFVLGLCIVLPAHADVLSQIKQRGQIVIGTEARYAPFEYIENGEIVGYDRELLKAVMEKLPEVKIVTRDLPWQGILPGLAQRKLDFVVTAVSITKPRAKQYSPTVPVAEATVALLVRADDKSIEQNEDAAGKIVGSQQGSGQLASTKHYNKKLKSETGNGMKRIREYVSFDDAYSDLLNQRLDAVGQSLPNLLYIQKKRPNEYKVIMPPFGEPLYFSWVGRKDEDSKSLVSFFNKRLIALRNDGTMKKLQEKWFGFVMETPDHPPNPE